MYSLVPGARKSQECITGGKDKGNSPPVDDAANRAVTEYLASFLGVSKYENLLSCPAQNTRDKVLLIKNMSLEAFL